MSAPKPEAMHVRAAKGSVVSAVSFAFTFASNLIQVSLVLGWWSQSQYGSWLAVIAVAGLIQSLEMGHLQYVGNRMAAEWFTNRADLRVTLGSAIRVVFLTGALQLAVVAVLGWLGKLDELGGQGADGSGGFVLSVLLLILGNVLFGSIAAVVVRLLAVAGLFVRGTAWGIVIRGVQLGSLCLAAYLNLDTLGAVLVCHAFGGALAAFLYADLKRLFPDLWPWWREGCVKTGLSNLRRSTVLMVSLVLEALSNQGIVVIVGSLLGAASIPLLTTLRTLANTVAQGASFLLNPIQPDVVRFGVARSAAKLAATFRVYWLLVGTVAVLFVVPGLLVVERVYGLWTRGVLPYDRWLFCTLAVSVVLRVLYAPFLLYFVSMNRLSEQLAAAAVRALVVLSLSHACAGYGLAGVGLAVLVAEVAASVVLPAWWMWREFERLASPGGLALLAIPTLASALVLGAVGAYAWAEDALFYLVLPYVVVAAAFAGHLWFSLEVGYRDRIRALARPAGWRGEVADDAAPARH